MKKNTPAEVLWTPSNARRSAARLTQFTLWLERERGLRFANYDALWEWSVSDGEGFWGAIWAYFDLPYHRPPTGPLVQPSVRLPGARWYEGCELNIVDQMFANATPDTPALLCDSETLGESQLSWADLQQQVASVAACLRSLGVVSGDRVVAYLPNIGETVVAFLATASIGAVWAVCAPDMGPRSVADRFAQINPKVFISCDGYRFAGKAFERSAEVAEILAQLPSVQHLIWLPCLDPQAVAPAIGGRGVVAWADVIALQADFRSEPVPFDHPLWILYSSGTTGLPKAIVHGHGGILLNGMVIKALHTDLGPGDRYFWTSSTSWMVWNAHVLGLMTGATLCLYDGAVTGPGPTADWGFLWRLASRRRVRIFGAGAAFHASCLKAGVVPRELCDLSVLDTVCSTGSPLSPDAARWLYDSVSSDLWLNCVSGGTDIAGAFLAGSPTLPVYLGEMQCRTLGAAVHAFDEYGEPVIDAVGELVCIKPMPSMPLYFWGDAGDVRYHESYFETYRGPQGEPIWRHGDWVRLLPREGATGGIIYGRSDATINRHGIRMGTSELYSAAEALPEVLDSLVVDLEFLGRESCLLMFVVLADRLSLDAVLMQRVRDSIRRAVSPRHVPDELIQVDQIPRTLTGKKLELPVKKLLLGEASEKVVQRDAMANPTSLDWFIAFAAARNAELPAST